MDGESHNRSWNCGVEGPTDDPAVLALRGTPAPQLPRHAAALAGRADARCTATRSAAPSAATTTSTARTTSSPGSTGTSTRAARDAAGVHPAGHPPAPDHPVLRRRRFFAGAADARRRVGPARHRLVQPVRRAHARRGVAPRLRPRRHGVPQRRGDRRARPARRADRRRQLPLLYNASHEDLDFTMPTSDFGTRGPASSTPTTASAQAGGQGDRDVQVPAQHRRPHRPPGAVSEPIVVAVEGRRPEPAPDAVERPSRPGRAAPSARSGPARHRRRPGPRPDERRARPATRGRPVAGRHPAVPSRSPPTGSSWAPDLTLDDVAARVGYFADLGVTAPVPVPGAARRARLDARLRRRRPQRDLARARWPRGARPAAGRGRARARPGDDRRHRPQPHGGADPGVAQPRAVVGPRRGPGLPVRQLVRRRLVRGRRRAAHAGPRRPDRRGPRRSGDLSLDADGRPGPRGRRRGRRAALLRPRLPGPRRDRRAAARRARRPPALPAGVLAGRGRGAQLPPVLRRRHPRRDPRRGPRGLRREPRGSSSSSSRTAPSTASGSTTRTAWPTPPATSPGSTSSPGGAWVAVEKILAGEEELPADWDTVGHHRLRGAVAPAVDLRRPRRRLAARPRSCTASPATPRTICRA